MQIQTWENNQWRQGPPQAKDQQVQEAAPTGLQVALQVRGVEAPMIKAFLLGGI
jgi:hypothetical protein